MKYLICVLVSVIFSGTAIGKSYIVQKGDSLYDVLSQQGKMDNRSEILRMIPQVVQANPKAFLNGDSNHMCTRLV